MKFRNGFKRTAALWIAVLLLAECIFAPSVYAGVFSSQSIQTSYYEKGKISIEVRENEMTVTVPQSSEFSYIIVTFMDSQGNAPHAARPAKVSEGTVIYEIADRRDGVYYIQLYRNENAQGTFTGVIGGMESIAVLMENGSAKIIPSLVYDSSVKKFSSQAVSADALCYYLRPSSNVQSGDPDIVRQALAVTEGKTAAYDKLVAVHDWVASNIYYDYDALKAGSGWPVDASGTLKTRRTVCEGYANLATAMLRANGIPAKTIIGYALYDDENSWNLSNMYGDRANHAWTEAFVNGRWILMDVTWDSDNVYENGGYRTSEALHTYFDSTLEFFSYTHRQSYHDEYDSSAMKIEFSDVAGHWALEPIRFAVNNDLMNGVGGSYFSPDSETTQAMFLTVLARLSGDELTDTAEGDQDVQSSLEKSEWYSPAVAWARQKGILQGIDAIFDPDAQINRQMMAVMLRNYIKYAEPELAAELEKELTESAADAAQTSQASGQPLSASENGQGADGSGGSESISFTDQSDIASWASEAVLTTVRLGFLKGYDDGSFGPENTLTRAEMATVIERLKYKKLMQILG